MEQPETDSISLELKYCERCGGLGLRPKGSDLLFCAGCARAIAGVAPNSRSATEISHGRTFSAGPQPSSPFWTEGGNA